MKTYRLRDGDSLAVSVNGSVPQTVVFRKAAFEDIAAATGEEIARACRSIEGVHVEANDDGVLLTTEASGGHSSLEIALAASTAAGALGLVAGPAAARGQGLVAAELVSIAAEPYDVPANSELAVAVDGKRHRYAFAARSQRKPWTASEVAERINKTTAGVASVRKDGRLRLTSPRVGHGSSVRVLKAGRDKKDAAKVLGFTGSAASSEPYAAAPARLICSGATPGVEATNLTGSPLELHLERGRLLLPPRTTVGLAPRDAANGPLQRLVQRGALRLSAAKR